MIIVGYTSEFVRLFKKLESLFQEEVTEKIDFFKDIKNHKSLKEHKLHGRFSKCYSFSVNYKTRIVFQYLSDNHVIFLTIGDHDVYK